MNKESIEALAKQVLIFHEELIRNGCEADKAFQLVIAYIASCMFAIASK